MLFAHSVAQPTEEQPTRNAHRDHESEHGLGRVAGDTDVLQMGDLVNNDRTENAGPEGQGQDKGPEGGGAHRLPNGELHLLPLGGLSPLHRRRVWESRVVRRWGLVPTGQAIRDLPHLLRPVPQGQGQRNPHYPHQDAHGHGRPSPSRHAHESAHGRHQDRAAQPPADGQIGQSPRSPPEEPVGYNGLRRLEEAHAETRGD